MVTRKPKTIEHLILGDRFVDGTCYTLLENPHTDIDKYGRPFIVARVRYSDGGLGERYWNPDTPVNPKQWKLMP